MVCLIWSNVDFENTNIDLNEAISIVKDSYQDNPCEHSTLFEGVAETLKTFHEKGIAQIIISNKPSFLIPLVLEGLGIQNLFLKAYGGEDFPKRKPHPMAVEAVFNLNPKYNHNNVLMVGDMSPDIDMAKNAGIDSVFCAYGYATQPLEATFQIQSFSELENLNIQCL